MTVLSGVELMCIGIVDRANLEEVVEGFAVNLMSDAKDETEISDQYLTGLNKQLRVLELLENIGIKVPGTFDPSAQSDASSSEVDDPAVDSDSAGEAYFADAQVRSKIDQNTDCGDPDTDCDDPGDESDDLDSIDN